MIHHRSISARFRPGAGPPSQRNSAAQADPPQRPWLAGEVIPGSCRRPGSARPRAAESRMAQGRGRPARQPPPLREPTGDGRRLQALRLQVSPPTLTPPALPAPQAAHHHPPHPPSIRPRGHTCMQLGGGSRSRPTPYGPCRPAGGPSTASARPSSCAHLSQQLQPSQSNSSGVANPNPLPLAAPSRCGRMARTPGQRKKAEGGQWKRWTVGKKRKVDSGKKGKWKIRKEWKVDNGKWKESAKRKVEKDGKSKLTGDCDSESGCGQAAGART